VSSSDACRRTGSMPYVSASISGIGCSAPPEGPEFSRACRKRPKRAKGNPRADGAERGPVEGATCARTAGFDSRAPSLPRTGAQVKFRRGDLSTRGRRPISRVLSRTAIHLGRASPRASSDRPGSRVGHTSGVSQCSPIWSCSGWGLPCHSRYRERGALLPHHFTLTPHLPATHGESP